MWEDVQRIGDFRRQGDSSRWLVKNRLTSEDREAVIS